MNSELKAERAALYREVYMIWEESSITKKYHNDNIASYKAEKAVMFFDKQFKGSTNE